MASNDPVIEKESATDLTPSPPCRGNDTLRSGTYLKCHSRLKDGKEHHYYSLAEKVPCAGGRRIERHVLSLGEINDSQQAAWLKCTGVFDLQAQRQTRLALFAATQPLPAHAVDLGVPVRLAEFSIHHPRQWGACWVFLRVWQQLQLDEFWRQRLPESREHTDWYHILVVLCAYRWIDPGSEWRLHRDWYERSAMADLLGADFALAAKDNLYRCLDKLVRHKRELFSFLRQRWEDLFGVTFDVLLYDLTSTYFESDPPFAEGDKRQFGYSRDKRSDCVQVVIATGERPATVAGAIELGTAATVAAPNHGKRRVGKWLQTFANPSLILNSWRILPPSSSESRVNSP